MRKLSLVLIGAAGLALVAGAAATPALAEVNFGINIGPPVYSQPYYGQYYGRNSRYYSAPSYNPYATPRFNVYVNPYSGYTSRYDRHYYPGYYSH